MSSPIEITVFAKANGALTKKLELDGNGRLVADSSQCIMSAGTARRFHFATMQDVCKLIVALQQNEAIATGTLRSGLPEQVEVATKRELNGADHPGVIARTQKYIVYRPGKPALALIDFDTKGMPPAVANRMSKLGGFWPAIVSVLPALAKVGRIDRASTSAGLFNRDNGELLPGIGGKHLYVLVADGADIERFLKTLHERCWLAGLGWVTVGAAGQFLDRSIVDRVTGGPERLAFEGRPVMVPPLDQDPAVRRPMAVEGEAIDTRRHCPPLTIVGMARLDELRAKCRNRLAGESAKARQSFIAKQSERLRERATVELDRARKIIERHCEGVLLPDIELPFDDAELVGKTVGDVLADPIRFEGETLADPLEGVEYGRGKARIMRRPDGSVWIRSFAHGRTFYELKLDIATARAALEKTTKDRAADLLVRLVLAADLDEDEVEELRNMVSGMTGITKGALGRKIKNACAAAAAERALLERDRRIAERQDPRRMLPVPATDAEFVPQMRALNEVIKEDPAPEPPIRNPNYGVALARSLTTPSLHVLTSEKSNPDAAV